MIRYTKGPEPLVRRAQATVRLDELRATPGANWDALGTGERQPIREALVRDQGGLCAYCQRRIAAELDDEGRPRMKIEHWAAQSTHPDLQLKWTNLVGVCLGSAPVPPDLRTEVLRPHCDASRGHAPLFLHPVEGQGPDPREHLSYTQHGVVAQARPLPADRDDIKTLNLNDKRLTRARADVYFREIVSRLRGLPEADALRLLKQLARATEVAPGRRALEHAEFVRYHVLKKLRQRGEPA